MICYSLVSLIHHFNLYIDPLCGGGKHEGHQTHLLSGAFTKALIEAIGEGKADITHKGRITTSLLDAYLAERVKTLTDGEQHPVMSRPDAVPDFPLALVK